MKKTMLIAGFLVVGLFVFRHKTREREKDSEATITLQAPAPKQAENLVQKTQSVAPTPDSTQKKDERPSKDKRAEKKALSKAQFTSKFKSKPFEQVLRNSQAFTGYNGEIGRYLPGVELGLLLLTDGTEMAYNLFLSSNAEKFGPKSCIGIQKPNQEGIVGIGTDHTLGIREFDKDDVYALIFKFRDQYFFVYDDPNGKELRPDGRSFFDSTHILYYAKQPDGKIVFQGEKERTLNRDSDSDEVIKRVVKLCPLSPGFD
jgi:hypothetical protein